MSTSNKTKEREETNFTVTANKQLPSQIDFDGKLMEKTIFFLMDLGHLFWFSIKISIAIKGFKGFCKCKIYYSIEISIIIKNNIVLP